MSPDPFEIALAKLRQSKAQPLRWDTPADIARRITPTTVQTPALDLIDQAIMRAYRTPDSRLIISMPPQEGKSVRVAKDYPIWVLTQNPNMRIIAASYGQSLATRNGKSIRNTIVGYDDLGLDIADDNGAAHEWTIDGHEGGVYSVGVGGALTGRPADLIIIDDPHKDRAAAESKTQRDAVWDWWTSTANSRLAPGASVVVIMTRWHADDLAGRLLAQADSEWEFLNIPAQADHDPAKGETDVLGRNPGEFMVSARGRTRTQWERRKREAGPRDWQALYQGSPSLDDGGVFPPTDQWERYDRYMWTESTDGVRTVPGMHRDDYELVQSWDLAFKDTESSDYVVGQVWLRVGTNAYLLDMVRDRLNFNATVEAIRTMTAKWPQAVAKFVEDKANGPAVIAALQRTMSGLIPVEPEGSKYARANAIAPFVWARNVVLPTPRILPNVGELLEETKAFPNSPHDDTVDALSQAVSRLLLHPLTDGVHQPDEYDDLDDRGWAFSPL